MKNTNTEITTLEQELAYEAARSNIEIMCNHRQRDTRGLWYDTDNDTILTNDTESIEKSVRYLEHKNLLERHPDNSRLVRILDLPTTGECG